PRYRCAQAATAKKSDDWEGSHSHPALKAPNSVAWYILRSLAAFSSRVLLRLPRSRGHLQTRQALGIQQEASPPRTFTERQRATPVVAASDTTAERPEECGVAAGPHGSATIPHRCDACGWRGASRWRPRRCARAAGSAGAWPQARG